MSATAPLIGGEAVRCEMRIGFGPCAGMAYTVREGTAVGLRWHKRFGRHTRDPERTYTVGDNARTGRFFELVESLCADIDAEAR